MDRILRFIQEMLYPPPPPPPPPLMATDWRKIDWGERNQMKDNVRNLELSKPDVKILRILIHGPVGAGKSSFINSIDSIFQDRMTSGAIADNKSSHSFTKTYQTHKIKDGKYGTYLPFVICDSMGIEDGHSQGMLPEDLSNILKGHIKDGLKLNAGSACSEKDRGYNHSPKLEDEVHCLVSILKATTVSMMPDDVFKKMKDVRAKATEMRIPQVALLTLVDETCPEVKKDLKQVYKSHKIRNQMEKCSNDLGIPMNCIFPVKNYHEEIHLNNDIDVLLLSALTHILNFANDHVAEITPTEI
ncbi:interferon-induced protein 44-like [Alosa pseudoharengus]|uniref:interferon-induced protein 44-like n=1 Tax=Alosa pseudoharengus TaxID=34774 RepID=UPI003F8A89C3